MTDEEVVSVAVHEHTPADWAHVACPWCDRLAVIQLYADAQVQVSHECPGPWLLDSIDPTDDDRPTWGLAIGAGGRPLLCYPSETLGTGSDADL